MPQRRERDKGFMPFNMMVHSSMIEIYGFQMFFCIPRSPKGQVLHLATGFAFKRRPEEG
jgi:hypothetical protein